MASQSARITFGRPFRCGDDGGDDDDGGDAGEGACFATVSMMMAPTGPPVAAISGTVVMITMTTATTVLSIFRIFIMHCDDHDETVPARDLVVARVEGQ